MNVEQLKDHIKQESIVHIIERYIPLAKKGANWEAICPFHNDSNPSLKVSESKGLYKCFVCGAAGDAIKFVQDYKMLGFMETMEEMAQTLGVPFERETKKVSPKVEMAQRILKASSKLFYNYANNPPYESIYKNFLTNRRLRKETADLFQIGFAPQGNLLLNYLQKHDAKHKGFTLKVAKELQIIKEFDRGPYDAFRQRITFPIWDKAGRVIGFGSRSISDEQMPKYLNSSESFLFKKRSVLYPYHLAKPSLREKKSVLLVEGYMDAITLHQSGFKNTLAIMGIALSDQSISFLKRQVKKFYLCLDNDNAGFKAATQINHQMMSEGLLPYYVDLSPHKDPDDFIKQEGSLEFQKRIDEASPFIDKQIDSMIPDKAIENSEARLNLFKEIIALLSPLKMDLSATERVLKLAKRLGLQSPADTLIDIYKAQLSEEKKPQRSAPPIQPPLQEPPDYNNYEDLVPPPMDIEPVEELGKTDRFILKTLVQNPEALNYIALSQVIDFTTHSEVKSLLAWMAKIYPEIDESEYKSIMMNYVHNHSLDTQLSNLISDSLYNLRAENFSDELLKKFSKDFLRETERKKLRDELLELRQKYKAALNADEASEYEKRIEEINKKINELNIL